MEPLPTTLDALLAHDGKDVGTALPTEVWASTSQGTLRCWSEGAKLRLEKATDATAAPADAVLIAFKSAEAEREMIDGPKALVAAVAAGRISVRGDVVALRPAAERIVAALQRGAPIAVDAPEKRTDGVLVYAVRDGDRRAARRYREFRALRKRLVATENGHAKDVLKIPFPVKGPVLRPERRRRPGSTRSTLTTARCARRRTAASRPTSSISPSSALRRAPRRCRHRRSRRQRSRRARRRGCARGRAWGWTIGPSSRAFRIDLDTNATKRE